MQLSNPHTDSEVKLHLLYAFRYITALTDSEEEELSDEAQSGEEQPVDRLCVLLERVDHLHKGSESDKMESLNILLEQREEVCVRVCMLCL